MVFKTIPNIALSLLLPLGLAACGGGGDGSTANSGQTQACTNGSSNAPACDNHQVSVPAPTYATDANELIAFNQINTIRQKMGIGLLAQNGALDTAAAAHANYIKVNNLCSMKASVDPGTGLLWIHSETVGKPGFTGAVPLSRANAAGYSGSYGSEVATCGSASSQFAANWFINSVYHRAGLLNPALRDVGIAVLPGAANVIATGYKIEAGVPVASFVGTYPFDGQTGVTTGFKHAVESPRPLPDINPVDQRFVGNPVSIQVANGNTLTVSSFELFDPAGNKLSARLLTAATDPARKLKSSAAYLVPLKPLAAGQTYRVVFTGTDNGLNLTKSWSFTTADKIDLLPAGNLVMKGTDTLRITVKTPSGYWSIKNYSVDRVPGDMSPSPGFKDDQDGTTITGSGAVSNTLVLHLMFYDRADPAITLAATVTVTP
ncbi:CAP domain-containing protein [Chitinimonas sp. BJB300]|uniref:CAP domain-containing protein n=1 Tax=Chitinimonas sp. BJB300 TaxID=1559339 RepID=UPI000C104138|nr:CAP domain-containing protein [Chitinimonas sp. BJB300]PHV12228.1 hypothetical protein CSQ89_06780 [Chitinimonas sp. BJB300]TSJ85203.1 CAP domain-containing protein [Chitinimonas sp. BJB300]